MPSLPLPALLLLPAMLAAQDPPTPDPVDWVDQRIGTISHLLAPIHPITHLPFGMVRVLPVPAAGSPDHRTASLLRGFALNIAGHRERAVTLILPVAGDPELLDDPAIPFDHDWELQTPYLYALTWPEQGLIAEITADRRASHHRYRFRGDGPHGVVFRNVGKDGTMTVVGDRTIAGSEGVSSKGIGHLVQYFCAEFSRPFAAARTTPGGAWARFAGANPVQVRIGISYIDPAQAQANGAAAVKDWDFAAQVAAHRQEWNQALGLIRVAGGEPTQRRVFYTALSRVYERMVDINEGGRYFSAYAGTVVADPRPFYVDDWTWDTFRAAHPLRLLIMPERAQDMLASYGRMYAQCGWLPTVPRLNGPDYNMLGNHPAAMAADAWAKGLRSFDLETVYAGVRKNALAKTALPWRGGPPTSVDAEYQRLGYLPALAEDEAETCAGVHPWERRQAVAVTLEMAYDDWCAGQLAKALGKTEDYAVFSQRSTWYRNVWRSDLSLMAPRKADGSWVEPFTPGVTRIAGGRNFFAETPAWTYSWFVPHDVPGLAALWGGDAKAVAGLDRTFDQDTGLARFQFLAEFPDSTGLIGRYVAGNEPGFHVPYLYACLGAPWKTQERIRQIAGAWFRDDLMGLPGDEDGGGMSAWMVFSALGFYPLCPGRPLYIIGSPSFPDAAIALPGGRTFRVLAPLSSLRAKYIAAATLDGRALDRAWLTHEEVARGGTLELTMSEIPHRKWGADQLPPLAGDAPSPP